MKFLKMKNEVDSIKMYFYGDIIGSEWDKWTEEDQCPTDIKNILNGIDNNKTLNIHINSGGGSVFGGLAIYNMLKRHEGKKIVHVDGLAGSIASVIAMAGDEIYMPKNAMLMIHKPWVQMAGNADDLRKQAETLDMLEESILSVYETKINDGVGMDEIKNMVNNETWLTGSEAEKYFNIKVIEEQKAVACTSDMFAKYNHVPKEVLEHKQDEIEQEIVDQLLIEIELL